MCLLSASVESRENGIALLSIERNKSVDQQFYIQQDYSNMEK